MSGRDALPAGYFEGMYAGTDDPWDFTGRWYEQRKRALTLACLPRPRFRSAIEPGCSLGVTSEALAPRCDQLLCTDAVARPVDLARARLSGHPHVRVEQRAVPDDWPTDQGFDLVVLSEVAYYLSAEGLGRLVEAVVGSLTSDGVVLLCHWRHPVAEYPLTADEVHAAFTGAPELPVRLVRHEEDDFLLDVLAPPGAVSVAVAEGLVG